MISPEKEIVTDNCLAIYTISARVGNKLPSFITFYFMHIHTRMILNQTVHGNE